MAEKKWRERAIGIIKSYLSLKEELKELQSYSITPRMTGTPGGGGGGRKVENVALKELPKEKSKQFNAVRQAIKCTKRRYDNADERLKVIDLVYWTESHDLQGAALKVGYSYDTVQEWHSEFIKMVDAFYLVL